MPTRDLTYLINFDVTDTQELSDAAGDMETLATKADDLDTATPSLDLDLPEGLDTAATDISDVSVAVGDLGTKAETETGKVSGLRGAFGDLGLTTLGLGTAFDLVSDAIGTLSGWFDGLNEKSRITEAGSSAAADEVFRLFDGLSSLQDVTFETDTGLGALNEAFRTGIEAANAGDLEKVSQALADLGIEFTDLSATMLAFQADEAAAFSQVAADAGIPLDLAAALGEAATAGDSVNETLTALSGEGIRAFGEAAGLTGEELSNFVGQLEGANQASVDSFLAALPEDARAAGEAILEQVGAIEQLDDAAENTSTTLDNLIDVLKQSPEGAAAFEEIKASMPDASDTEVLQALVDRLAEIDANADGAAEGLDAVATDREATITATEEGSEDVRREFEDAAADRDTTITAEADTAQADSDISAFEDTTRTVSTYLSLVNGPEFDTVIDNHTDPQTISVNLTTGTITLPSASELARRIGTVRVPVSTYLASTRLEGLRR